MSHISIDIVMYDAMSYDQKQEFVDKLYKDGYVAEEMKQIFGNPILYDDWDNTIIKLIGNGWRLPREDADLILKIISKNLT